MKKAFLVAVLMSYALYALAQNDVIRELVMSFTRENASQNTSRTPKY